MSKLCALTPKLNDGFALAFSDFIANSFAIIGILSGIILFSAAQYINSGKDSNVAGNLVALIPSAEAYYNSNGNSYVDFCNPAKSTVLASAISQMPINPTGACTTNANPAGVCCNVEGVNFQAWVACAQEFTNKKIAYCVDSRGVKKEICNSSCISISSDLLSSCDVPGDNFPTCPSQ